MVFNESTVKIQTRVISAIGRLRPSKSAAALASFFNSHSAPPVPNRPSNAPAKSVEPQEEEFLDIKPTEPVILKRSNKKLIKRATGFKSTRPEFVPPKPVLTEMLEQQGLLDSPISVHITSLIVVPCGSERSSFDSRITRRRSSSDSAYLERLLCTSSAGPFTPELVVMNIAGKSVPEFSVPNFTIVEPQSVTLVTSDSPDDYLNQNDQPISSEL